MTSSTAEFCVNLYLFIEETSAFVTLVADDTDVRKNITKLSNLLADCRGVVLIEVTEIYKFCSNCKLL